MALVKNSQDEPHTRLEDVALNEPNPFDGDEMFVAGVNQPPPRQPDEFPQSELQFQDFEHRGSAPPRSDLIQEQQINIPEEEFHHEEPQRDYGPPPNTKPWHLEYYKFMFDIDTVQVLTRLLRSLIPIGKSFFDTISPNPDLYGPFWVVTTLVFMTAAVWNFGSYLSYLRADSSMVNYDYDFTMLSYAAATFYGYWLVVSFGLWGLCRYWKVQLKLIEILCLYGYSLFVYIPISVLCVIPILALQWSLVAVSGAETTVFIVLNLFGIFKREHLKRGIPVLIVLALLHIGLALGLKLFYFAYKDWSDIIPTSAIPTSSSSSSIQPTGSGF